MTLKTLEELVIKRYKARKMGVNPEPIRYKTVKLKPEEYKKCSCAENNGLVYMERDLHKSAGWVPCSNWSCEGGVIKKKSVPVYRVKARRS